MSLIILFFVPNETGGLSITRNMAVCFSECTSDQNVSQFKIKKKVLRSTSNFDDICRSTQLLYMFFSLLSAQYRIDRLIHFQVHLRSNNTGCNQAKGSFKKLKWTGKEDVIEMYWNLWKNANHIAFFKICN